MVGTTFSHLRSLQHRPCRPYGSSVGNVVANIYIGDVLWTFAEQQNGTWQIVVNQDNVIQSINNSYTLIRTNFPSGRRARVRVELQVSNTLGVEILPTDSITITGRILDVARGLGSRNQHHAEHSNLFGWSTVCSPYLWGRNLSNEPTGSGPKFDLCELTIDRVDGNVDFLQEGTQIACLLGTFSSR